MIELTSNCRYLRLSLPEHTLPPLKLPLDEPTSQQDDRQFRQQSYLAAASAACRFAEAFAATLSTDEALPWPLRHTARELLDACRDVEEWRRQMEGKSR